MQRSTGDGEDDKTGLRTPSLLCKQLLFMQSIGRHCMGTRSNKREMGASFNSQKSQSPPRWGLAPYPPARCTQVFTDLTTSALRQGLFLTRFTSQMMIWDTLFVILKLMFPVLLHEQYLKWLEWYPRRHLYSDKLIGPILLLSAVATK